MSKHPVTLTALMTAEAAMVAAQDFETRFHTAMHELTLHVEELEELSEDLLVMGDDAESRAEYEACYAELKRSRKALHRASNELNAVTARVVEAEFAYADLVWAQAVGDLA